MPPRKPPGAPPPPGTKRLTYEQVRDSFLAETPQTAEEELHYFTRIGMYVFGRWQAIADDHKEGQVIDESAHDGRWDECTDRKFSKNRDDAAALIQKEVQRERTEAFLASWWEALSPVQTILKTLAWIVMRALEHFFGAIGLIVFGLLLIWLAPHIVRDVRGLFDENLPVETRPYSETLQGREAEVRPDENATAAQPSSPPVARTRPHPATAPANRNLRYEGDNPIAAPAPAPAAPSGNGM